MTLSEPMCWNLLVTGFSALSYSYNYVVQHSTLRLIMLSLGGFLAPVIDRDAIVYRFVSSCHLYRIPSHPMLVDDPHSFIQCARAAIGSEF